MAKGKKSRKLKKKVQFEEAIETRVDTVSGISADRVHEHTASVTEEVPGENSANQETARTSHKFLVREMAVQEAARASATAVKAPKFGDIGRMSRGMAVNAELARHAWIMLLCATLVGLSFGLAMYGLEGGRDGVPAMGGMLDTQVPAQTASIVFFLDTLFPITFGSGFALLASSLQMRGNRPIIRLLLTAILVGVAFDFMENALVFSTLTGEEPYVLRWPMTVMKYACFGFASVLLSAVLPKLGKLGTLVQLMTRFLFPISIAVLLSGLGGVMARDWIGASFPVLLLLLALYARQLSKTD